jgi:hypothetical protein
MLAMPIIAVLPGATPIMVGDRAPTHPDRYRGKPITLSKLPEKG